MGEEGLVGTVAAAAFGICAGIELFQLTGVPAALGGLAREAAAQKLAGIRGERAELLQLVQAAPDSAQGVADVLAAAVAWARSLGVDPELALRERTARVLAALPDEAAPE